MRRKALNRRSALVFAAAAAVWLAFSWLVYAAVWRSPHRSDLATFWAFAAAVAVPLIAVTSQAWRVWARSPTAADSPDLDRFADLLAEAVRKDWEKAATAQRLLSPDPIPVRWNASSAALAGPVSAAVGSTQFPPLPGLRTVSQNVLRAGGVISDLHAVYGGLGSGRLVIAGAPGSGKSGAGVLLVLAALRHRKREVSEAKRPEVPVPVMFTLNGWAPDSQPVQDWLVSRLQEGYPLFAGKRGAAVAAGLLSAGRLAVVLDGLDEIPRTLRPVALQRLSEQATFRLVLLTRPAEMATAAAQSLLYGAAAIELQDVDPQTAASYLAGTQVDPAPPGWRDLMDRLRNDSSGPLAQALGNPLALTLVRDTYSTADDVRELLEFCDATARQISGQNIIQVIGDYLMDRVLPAAYPPQQGERHDPASAQWALRVIASHMNIDGTHELRWWTISNWVPAGPRIRAIGIVFGLALVAFVFPGNPANPFSLIVRLVLGLGTGFMFAGLFGRGNRTPMRVIRVRWGLAPRAIRGELPNALFVGLSFGAIAGFTAGLRSGSLTGIEAALAVGAVLSLAAALAYGMVGMIMEGSFLSEEDDANPLTPLASWRRDRTASFAIGLAFGLAVAVVGMTIGALAETFTPLHGFWVVFRGGLVGLVFGLGCSLGFSVTLPASLAFIQLARRVHTPVRLMRFLDDACQRGVMRTVGPAYQFRHARLQERLDTQVPEAPPHDQVLSRS